MAVIFVITSLSYTYVTSSRPSSESTILNVKIEDTAAPAKSAAPVQTPAVPAQKAVPAAPDKSAAGRARRVRSGSPGRGSFRQIVFRRAERGAALASALPQTYAYGRGASPAAVSFWGDRIRRAQ